MKGKKIKENRKSIDKSVIYMLIVLIILEAIFIINDLLFSRISYIFVIIFISFAVFFGVLIIYLIYVVIKESRGLS